MKKTEQDSFMELVLSSRVYEVAKVTALDKAHKLSNKVGSRVYLKREDTQSVYSFKLRGAYNRISQLSNAEKARGVIAASAGNHAQGVALSAQKLGLSAMIVMPVTTPSIKIEAVKRYGAQVELHGDSYSDAADYCKHLVKETNRVYIHPFDDPLVIAGQGTIGREIIEQLPQTSHIFVPVGGGGLIAGIASYVKAVRPDILIISVEPEDSNAMQQSVRDNERIILDHVGIFADGVAVKQVGENTFRAALKLVDDFITVTTDQICSAMKDVFEDTRTILEPAGALAVAGINQYKLAPEAHAVAICSGANVTFERLQQVAERTLIGSRKEVMLAVTMPEKSGALRKFCKDVVVGHNINEVSYRLGDNKEACVLFGILTSGTEDKDELLIKLAKHNIQYSDLTQDNLTKEHLRHLMGGVSNSNTNEVVYDVSFPERPGALYEFLNTIGDDWNITLFHYKSMASDIGSVLIGFDVSEPNKLETKLMETGYVFTCVNEQASMKLLKHHSVN
jgi:threonine dehydratase